MLKQRLITGAIFVTAASISVYFLPTVWFAVVFGAFMSIALWEWGKLSGIKRFRTKMLYVVTGVIVATIAAGIINFHPDMMKFVMIIAVSWWLIALFSLTSSKSETPFFMFRNIKLFSGLLVIVTAWLAAAYLHWMYQQMPTALLFLFLIVWLADSGAYATGKLMGKTKLAPNISPGKTVEGMYGGLCTVAIFTSLVGFYYLELPNDILLTVLLVAIITALFSVIGDLVESKFKRVIGVKDSGRILPGHGGVLDRIDAFTAAAPIFTLCWIVFIQNGL